MEEPSDGAVAAAPAPAGTPAVGLLYDERMTVHRDLETDHPEQPARIVSIFNRLEATGLAARCQRIACRRAVREELESKHSQSHLDAMLAIEGLSEEEAVALGHKYNSVFLCPQSLEPALLAAGSVLEATQQVCSGSIQSAICVVRPPGHHAECASAMGFSIFGNVALAAAEARRQGWSKRTLIVDWDVHHGNGTQRMFDGDSSVLFFSTHRHDGGSFFPGGQYQHYSSHGVGEGEGYSMNVPWEVLAGAKVGAKAPGDAELLDAFARVLLPVCEDFQPDLVLVSAGFDAALGDPLGGCRVSPAGFYQLTKMLMGLAGGRLVLALEGGYNLESNSVSMEACARALLGDPSPYPFTLDAPEAHHSKTVDAVRRHLARFWPKLQDATGPNNIKLPATALQGSFLSTQLALREFASETGYELIHLRRLQDDILFHLSEVPPPPEKPVGGRRRVKVLHESFALLDPPLAYVVPVIEALSPDRVLEQVNASFDAGAHGVWLSVPLKDKLTEDCQAPCADADDQLQRLCESFALVREHHAERWVGIRTLRALTHNQVFKWISSKCPTADALWLVDVINDVADVSWEQNSTGEAAHSHAVGADKWRDAADMQPLQSLKRLRQNSSWLGLVFGSVACSHQPIVHHEQEANPALLLDSLGIGSRVDALFDGTWYPGTIVKEKDEHGRFLVHCDVDDPNVWTPAEAVRVHYSMGAACTALLKHWAGLATVLCDGIVTSGANPQKIGAMELASPLAWQVAADVPSSSASSILSGLTRPSLVFLECTESDSPADAVDVLRKQVSEWTLAIQKKS